MSFRPICCTTMVGNSSVGFDEPSAARILLSSCTFGTHAAKIHCWEIVGQRVSNSWSGEQLWGREGWCLHKFINYVLLYISHAFITFPIISLLLSLYVLGNVARTKARSSKISDGWLHSLTGSGLTSFFSVLPSVITGSSFVSASSVHDACHDTGEKKECGKNINDWGSDISLPSDARKAIAKRLHIQTMSLNLLACNLSTMKSFRRQSLEMLLPIFAL